MLERLDQIAASATGGDSKFTLEEALTSYSGMGYRKFELYSTGRGAALDMSLGLDYYREMAKKYNITYSSLHVAPIAEDLGETFDYAVKCAYFAEELGIKPIVFNASAKAHYAKALKQFLQVTEGHDFNTIIQIHVGRAVDSLDEVKELVASIDDPRLGVLHEVGSYHELGSGWKEVFDTFGDRIKLVHLKDMIGSQCVPFGTGEIDIPALFRYFDSKGYTGDYVCEMNPKDKENTNQYFRDGLEYIKKNCIM